MSVNEIRALGTQPPLSAASLAGESTIANSATCRALKSSSGNTAQSSLTGQSVRGCQCQQGLIDNMFRMMEFLMNFVFGLLDRFMGSFSSSSTNQGISGILGGVDSGSSSILSQAQSSESNSGGFWNKVLGWAKPVVSGVGSLLSGIF